jgi:hypothetical protein
MTLLIVSKKKQIRKPLKKQKRKTKIKSNMKHFNEFINESLDNTIFEGFLDKLKDAIENVVDNPKKYEKYISKVKENIDKEFTNLKGDDLKALKEMNNDETIKNVYKWVKPYYKKYEQKKYDDDVKAIAYFTLKEYSERAKKLVLKQFPDYNPVATLEIAGALFKLMEEEYYSNEYSYSSSHSSSSSRSSHRKSAGYAAAGAVAYAMRRR